MRPSDQALEGHAPSTEESLTLLRADDGELPAIVAAAAMLRCRFIGNTVEMNFLVNIKGGICPEECHYCSQSKLSRAPIDSALKTTSP